MCLIAWGEAYSVHLKNLETIQKWIIKIIFCKNVLYPSDSLYSLAQLLDIKQLYCTALILEQKKSTSKTSIPHAYQTRYRQGSFIVPKVTKTIGQRCFSFLGPKIYNQVPRDIKLLNSTSIFKSKIKMWLLSKTRTFAHKLIDIKNTYHLT